MTDVPTDNAPPATTVPPDEEPAARCPYCNRPFATDRLATLHLGETHPSELSEAEREAVIAARDEESDDLFVLHLKVIAALVVVFFAIAYLYVFVLSG
ncbi:MAG: C2HC-type zinc finger protein [Halodesulfurarchaeum sp.]